MCHYPKLQFLLIDFDKIFNQLCHATCPSMFRIVENIEMWCKVGENGKVIEKNYNFF